VTWDQAVCGSRQSAAEDSPGDRALRLPTPLEHTAAYDEGLPGAIEARCGRLSATSCEATGYLLFVLDWKPSGLPGRHATLQMED
jgi:hypothetical protein